MSEDQARLIVNEINDDETWDVWLSIGNIIVENMFSWLWEGIFTNQGHEAGIGELMVDKFNMYLYPERMDTYNVPFIDSASRSAGSPILGFICISSAGQEHSPYCQSLLQQVLPARRLHLLPTHRHEHSVISAVWT